MHLFLFLCVAQAQSPTPAEAFAAWTGAELAFEVENLPEGTGYDLAVPLPEEDREHAAAIALEQARHFPPGSLGDAGLKVVGIFAALGSETNDGYHQWDEELGGYAYFGGYNGRGTVVASHYTDRQLPLTLHHEWFHLLDTEVAAQRPYGAPEVSPLDRSALEALRTRRGPILREAVSDYASKNPGEDRAETARHLHAHLPDALLQVVERPDLPGSQRFLHVLAVQTEVLGADFDWMVDVALGRSLPRLHTRIRPEGQWVVFGAEDDEGVNQTLRDDLADLGNEAIGLDSPAEIVSHVALIAHYHQWIDTHWDVTPGTRSAFATAVENSIDSLPPSHRVLASTLHAATLEELAERLDPDRTLTRPLTHPIVAGFARDLTVNRHLARIDQKLDGDWRQTVRSVQPAMTRVVVDGGTASGVTLSPDGLILTAAHVADALDEKAKVIFPDGSTAYATCTAIDPDLDLALLQIDEDVDLPYVSVAATAPSKGSAVAIIGQPSDTHPHGKPTGYPSFHVSTGHIRGFAPDPLANQSRGGVAHDAWTYWGHSGSALLNRDGEIVALHNAWDPQTAMRHAVTWQAITAFLRTHRTP